MPSRTIPPTLSPGVLLSFLSSKWAPLDGANKERKKEMEDLEKTKKTKEKLDLIENRTKINLTKFRINLKI